MERCTVRSYLKDKALDRDEDEETPRPRLVKSSGTRVPNAPAIHVKGIVIRRKGDKV
jgi:hypothetical protein